MDRAGGSADGRYVEGLGGLWTLSGNLKGLVLMVMRQHQVGWDVGSAQSRGLGKG